MVGEHVAEFDAGTGVVIRAGQEGGTGVTIFKGSEIRSKDTGAGFEGGFAQITGVAVREEGLVAGGFEGGGDLFEIPAFVRVEERASNIDSGHGRLPGDSGIIARQEASGRKCNP